MRGLISVLLCVVLVLGTTFSGHEAHASPSEATEHSVAHHSHSAVSKSGHADKECKSQDCGLDLHSIACFSMAGHCIAALPGHPRAEARLLLPTDAGRIIVAVRHDAGLLPETETPPPRF